MCDGTSSYYAVVDMDWQGFAGMAGSPTNTGSSSWLAGEEKSVGLQNTTNAMVWRNLTDRISYTVCPARTYIAYPGYHPHPSHFVEGAEKTTTTRG